MVSIEDALTHMEGYDPPPQPVQQKFEGRERMIKRPHEMAERRMQMAALYAKGKYLETIGKHFGIST
jgi:hypothetical protein